MMLIMTMIVVVPRIILLEHRLYEHERSREGPGGATISTILNFLKG